MTFTLEIEMDNAAFDIDAGLELATLLRIAADRVELGVGVGKIYDVNGNHVGAFKVEY